MKLSSDVAQRITMLRPLLIFGVVFVHVVGFSDDVTAVGSSLFDYIASFLKNGVFRGAVPMLAMVSGFLLFGANLDQSPLKMFKKKFHTLVIPFLFFNFAYILGMIVLETATGIAPNVSLVNVTSVDKWLDLMFALKDYPFNFPLYFLRDMIVLIVLAPLFGYMLRNAPLLGLSLVTGTFWCNLDSYLVMRDASAILFYVGGMAATRNWDLRTLDRYAAFCLAAFVLICAALIVFRIRGLIWLVMVVPFLIWPASALLNDTVVGEWALKHSKYSFFVYIAHAPILLVFQTLMNRVDKFIPYPVYWFVAPVLTITILIVLRDLAVVYTPKLFDIVVGNRTKIVVTTSTEEEASLR